MWLGLSRARRLFPGSLATRTVVAHLAPPAAPLLLNSPTTDNFANLFALIKTVEKLEKAYVNSAVPSDRYEAACSELITKYKTLRNTLADTVPDMQHFMATYSMHCASARHRLHVGFPATIEHRVNRPGDSSSAVNAAECVHHYIGAMDTLKLNMAAKDQIAPCLSDLIISLYKVPQLPAEFAGKICIRRWIERLDNMRASDELGEEEVRQLLYDIENSYNTFMQLLGGGQHGDLDGGVPKM